jgi:hypothetical protein
MNTATTELQEKVDELLLVLQKDLEHIERSIEKLNELRELVIRRDDSGLSTLLEEIRSQSQEYIENQKLREQLRQRIGRILNWPVEQVRLGKLQRMVSGERAIHAEEVRKRLRDMILRLQSERAGTVVLLTDLARFNRMLLNTILETWRGCGITYDASGGTSRNDEVAFMNLRF